MDWLQNQLLRHHHGKLTREKAEEVIRLMNHRKDCNIGLNWDVMNYYVDQVMAEAE